MQENMNTTFLENFILPQEYSQLFDEAYHNNDTHKRDEFSALHKSIMKKRIQAIESLLDTLLLDPEIPSRLSQAMRYSLLAGGKRLRPILCLSMAKLCSSINTDKNTWLNAIPFAASLEMIHTYSLIHDDLPAMDNDDLRRGKPTCHKAFDEATAILAGDGLLTDAFAYMTTCKLPAENVLEGIRLISQAVGSQGMVGGQQLDMEAEQTKISLEELRILNAKKTGALIQCSCLSGATLVNANEQCKEHIKNFGSYIGIAFQIIDDILDVIGDTTLLGKNTGSDEAKEKSTWVSLLGIEDSKRKAIEFCQKSVLELELLVKTNTSFDKAELYFLQKTAHDMAHRVY